MNHKEYLKEKQIPNQKIKQFSKGIKQKMSEGSGKDT